MRRFPADARGDASRTTALTDPRRPRCSFMTRMATLRERLTVLLHQPRPEAGVVPYGEWMARGGPASAGPPGTSGAEAR